MATGLTFAAVGYLGEMAFLGDEVDTQTNLLVIGIGLATAALSKYRHHHREARHQRAADFEANGPMIVP
jgi:hypothetical protein